MGALENIGGGFMFCKAIFRCISKIRFFVGGNYALRNEVKEKVKKRYRSREVRVRRKEKGRSFFLRKTCLFCCGGESEYR